MRTMALAALLALNVSVARADALPDCPAGTHLETNPVAPGAMHHNGGECIRDGGCAITHHRRGAVAPALLLAALALTLTRARARARA